MIKKKLKIGYLWNFKIQCKCDTLPDQVSVGYYWGGDLSPVTLDRHINPIPIRGADYAHQIGLSRLFPLDLKKYHRACFTVKLESHEQRFKTKYKVTIFSKLHFRPYLKVAFIQKVRFVF